MAQHILQLFLQVPFNAMNTADFRPLKYERKLFRKSSRMYNIQPNPRLHLGKSRKQTEIARIRFERNKNWITPWVHDKVSVDCVSCVWCIYLARSPWKTINNAGT